MYDILHGSTVIMMLGGGGHKSSQNNDIERTKVLALAQALQNEQD